MSDNVKALEQFIFVVHLTVKGILTVFNGVTTSNVVNVGWGHGNEHVIVAQSD